MDRTEFLIGYGKVVSRSWQDQAYRERLIAHPRETLAEVGIAVPEHATVELVEVQPGLDGDPNMHLTRWERGTETGVYTMLLPSKPEYNLDDQILDDELLSAVAGGTMSSSSAAGSCCCCCPCCCCEGGGVVTPVDPVEAAPVKPSL